MIIGLLGLILAEGTSTFWPGPLVRVELTDGSTRMGERTRDETFRVTDATLDSLPEPVASRARPFLDEERPARRDLYRTGNFDLTNRHFQWIAEFEVGETDQPEWGLVLERREWGRFYGIPTSFRIDGNEAATDPTDIWALFLEHQPGVTERWVTRYGLQKHEFGVIHARVEEARLDLRAVEMEHGIQSDEFAAKQDAFDAVLREIEGRKVELSERVRQLEEENDRYRIVLETAEGQIAEIPLADVVRAYPANQLGFGDKVSVYLSRWWEFLTEDPRAANSEGGVWPAIVGTVVMTLLMSLAVVPLGVLAALYLREYAKAGLFVSIVRIAVNNLAGVPSIVFGVFGLGFFCYIVGGGIDEWLFSAKLPNPTYGTGGVLWASLTLALLTLPVVIVATEEALAAVPSSLREGSYGCGASKWQTIQRIVLPRALPGIMTGFILAMARGAGEVAPLMLVGAVKLAPELPLDGMFPYLHPDRSFMHLGFHIYDVGFQSQNSEAAKPMVFTTTLLLIVIITALNLFAAWVRTDASAAPVRDEQVLIDLGAGIHPPSLRTERVASKT